ncbi:Tetratricopeptide repeat-containing protein [Raineyella antarctica]|uniref:Tetratricopeptide repeat-containing protein n=1 Tax=Raineyella antarctica TaxID=1577474 RepID=A0A1G6HGI8_9ACTN|nr:tetratricopeptide repeat protein [Raineyella antarctica]SDB93284.1 Tetratricopeptide repeat-containing protein [Raineyella antarctica]
MADVLPLRIFLASPGDLKDEREVVRRCVDEFNARSAGVSHVRYEVVGWDRVRGTARRPQEAIDELISESHFLVTLFKGSWGSEPGGPWGYTSGTEEELFTGLLELGQSEQPMRDVWVAFLDHPSPDHRIVELREQMSQSHSMMYESIADLRELKEKLSGRLKVWAELAGAKVPRHVDLLPSSGADVLRAANLRLQGEKLVELGQAEAGRAALEEAAVLGGPLEQLAYARFLARHGDLAEASASTQRAIDFFINRPSDLYSPLAAQAFAAQARVLRRQGRAIDAIGRLQHALTLLPDPGDTYARKVRCQILDDLGLAYKNTGDLESARRCFEEALVHRRASQLGLDVCQSLVNLARLEIGAGDLETAARYADEVISTLRLTPPTALHANAEVLAAQVLLRQGRPEEGIPHAQKALALNQQIANRHGQAISSLVLAQCCRAAGRKPEAEEHARACLDVNKSIEDEVGMQKAQWVLDQLAE